MTEDKPRVAILMGSASDRPIMEECTRVLAELGVPHEVAVVSAHRQPERCREYARSARERGIQVIIAGAGGAAHLPGVLASWTTLPVIGVPLPTSDLRGVDALHAIVQMPAGVPVATVAIGTAGAKNAAYLAAQILALSDTGVRDAFDAFRKRLASG